MKRVKVIKGEKEDVPLCHKDRLDPKDAVRLFENRILTNPSITDCIFAGMSYIDLLNCSLVSKAWNLTCRSILVDSFNTYLTLSEGSTVKELQDFYDLISKSVPGHHLPLNGIRVKFSIQVFEWPFSSEPFASLIRQIMELLEVKTMSFDMSQMHLSATDFHEIFKTLLIPHSETLEFLEILNFDGIGNLTTLSQQLEVDSLPNLRELDLSTSLDRLKTSTFKRILRACPNLKDFPDVLPYQLPTLRDTNKLHLASKVRCNYMSLTTHDIQLLAEYSGLIQNLQIFQQDKWRVNKFEREWILRLLPMFSPGLQLTLEFLEIDLEVLVAILLQKSFPPLTNLKELICLGSMAWFHLLFRNSRIPLSQFLPNLEFMTIFLTRNKSTWLKSKYLNDDEDGSLSLSHSQWKSSGSLDSVKVLRLVGMEQRRGYVTNEAMRLMMIYLDKTFPCVTHLDIGFDCTDLEELMKWICESWGDLLETLILCKIKCLKLDGFRSSREPLRTPLPAGIDFSDKLSHLRRLELEFEHPVHETYFGHETEAVGAIFEPQEGQEVKLLISGCRARKRVSWVRCGVNIYETILALKHCPKDFGFSPMEKIMTKDSICKKICTLLPTRDLFSVSRVSRRWNAAARKELHQSRICTLTINPLTYEHGDTPSKLTWLSEGAAELFNALRIVMPGITPGVRIAPTVLANTALLESLVFEHTRFQVLELNGLQRQKAAPGRVRYSEEFDFNNMSTLLMPFLKNLLQKLELGQVQTLVTSIGNFDGLFRDDDGNLLVPNLKRIKFVGPEKLLDYPGVTKRLFEELPSLERIDNHFSNNNKPHLASNNKAPCVQQIQLNELPEKETLLDGEILLAEEDKSSEVMKLEFTNNAALASLLKLAQEHQPRVETLSAEKIVQVQPKNGQYMRKLIQLLCTGSPESLNALGLGPSLLRLVSMGNTRPTVALYNIDSQFYQRNSAPDQLLSQVQFPQMVPNLKTVTLMLPVLSSSSFSFDNILKDQQLFKTPGANLQPCTSVRSSKLKLMLGGNTPEFFSSYSPGTAWDIEHLAREFPHAKNFFSVISSTAEFNKILGSLWVSWPKLEIIKIYSNDNYIEAETFESWILGISKEEWSTWQELRGDGSSGELLNTMHYAPSTMSFRNCKNLEEFCVNCRIKTFILKTTRHSNSWKRLHLFTRNSEDEGLSGAEPVVERV